MGDIYYFSGAALIAIAAYPDGSTVLTVLGVALVVRAFVHAFAAADRRSDLERSR